MFLEIRAPTEEQKALMHKYASFMHSFIGRGVGKSVGSSRRIRRVLTQTVYLLLGILMLK